MLIHALFSFSFVFFGCHRENKGPLDPSNELIPFRIPYFDNADSLDRELGIIRLKLDTNEDDIELLAQLSAGYTFQAMMNSKSDSRRSLELARQYGLKCLRTSSGFESLLQSRGLRVTPKAIQVLNDEPKYRHCRQWTGISWSLWLIERGVLGAGIDVNSVRTMSPEVPKSMWDHYQHALALSLDIEAPQTEAIKRSLDLSLLQSPIPHRMYYEISRLTGSDNEKWKLIIEDDADVILNAVDVESIYRVFPEKALSD